MIFIQNGPRKSFLDSPRKLPDCAALTDANSRYAVSGFLGHASQILRQAPSLPSQK